MDLVKILKETRKFTSILSKGEIAGIPVDIISHLTVSILITRILIKFKIKKMRIIIIVLCLGLVKEFLDSFTLESPLVEHISDLSLNMIYPFWVWIYEKLKSKQV